MINFVIIVKVKNMFLIIHMLCTQSCLSLFDPFDCSLPGSFVHGISQARILEWVAILLQGIFQTQEST